MANTPTASVGMVTIDAPDAVLLANFYADLLGLELMHQGVVSASPSWPRR